MRHEGRKDDVDVLRRALLPEELAGLVIEVALEVANELREDRVADGRRRRLALHRVVDHHRLAEERQQTQRRQRDEAEACEARVAARGEECAAVVAASETALAQGEARWAQGEAQRAEEAARWAAERSELLAAAAEDAGQAELLCLNFSCDTESCLAACVRPNAILELEEARS